MGRINSQPRPSPYPFALNYSSEDGETYLEEPVVSKYFLFIWLLGLSFLLVIQESHRLDKLSAFKVDILTTQDATIWENELRKMVESTILRNNQKLTQIRTVFDNGGSPLQRTTGLKCGDFGRWTWARRYSDDELSFVDIFKGSSVVGLFVSSELPFGNFEYICDSSNKDILTKFANSSVEFKIVDSVDRNEFGKTLPWETKDCLMPLELSVEAIQIKAKEVQSFSRNNIVVFRKYVSEVKDSLVASWYDFFDRNQQRNAVFLVLRNGSKVLLIKSKTTRFSLLDVDSDGVFDLLEFTYDRLNKEVETLQFFDDKIDVLSEELREDLSSSTNYLLREIVEKLPKDK
ncbi:MAG: hypothetical protein ABL888_21635 [Pirellulaceae bacterium]